MEAQPRDPWANRKKDKNKETKLNKSGAKALPSKGFGAVKKKDPIVFEGVPIDDQEVDAFFKYLTAHGAEASKVTLANFGGLRGVMALQDIAPGEAIISIPYELSLDLGSESADPTAPAVAFLDHFLCEESPARPYLNQIPAPDSGDCTTTDFFSDDELALLQCPLVADATAARAAKRAARAAELDRSGGGADPNESVRPSRGLGLTLEQLRWATWVVVSRVLTVQGGGGASGGEADKPRKCLIPLIDMVNHHPTKGKDAVLSGRAAPGSFMKVLAGPSGVQAGAQVFIQYGGGTISSARFLQDYGFLDRRAARDADVGFALHVLSDADRACLAATCLDHDRALLDGRSGSSLTPCGRLAVQFRVYVKEALAARAPAAQPQTRVSMDVFLGN